MEDWEHAWKKKKWKTSSREKKITRIEFALVVDIAQNIISRIFANKKKADFQKHH